MYVVPNFRTKKALKEALKAGQSVRAYSPGVWPEDLDGVQHAEGPHAPAHHTWYARVEVKRGRVVKVLS